MSADILEGLRIKEEEMAVVIEEARLKAVAIREAAVRQAKEIKTAREIEAQALIREAGVEQDRLMRQEAGDIEAKALETANGLTVKGASRLEEAVEGVVRIVSGPYKGHA
ncbi:MAG: V-type ATPase subunit subunit G family protein [Deltaproteobacteria bacterium]